MALRGVPLFKVPPTETYRVLKLTPSMGSGSGSGGASTVSVPGNAATAITRAGGTLLTVEEIDADNVLLSLPPFIDAEDQIDAIASQLMYVFGPITEDELGWLTVTAKGILGLADSSDPGFVPDYIPVVGTVTLTPNLARPIRINSTGQFLAVATVSATFDSDGELSYDGIKNVRVLAPLWTDLSNTTWRWIADVRPGPGQSWSPFSVNFTGLPGATINLASLMT